MHIVGFRFYVGVCVQVLILVEARMFQRGIGRLKLEALRKRVEEGNRTQML